MRLTSPSWAAYALIMGRCCTGYTAISGAMPGMTHSYQTHGLLAAAWGHQSSYGYGLFEAEIPSEKMRWIRSLWGAECAAKDDARPGAGYPGCGVSAARAPTSHGAARAGHPEYPWPQPCLPLCRRGARCTS